MRYKIKTRDFKGNYDNLDDVRGWYFVGGECEIDTQSDSQALVFADSTTSFVEVKFDLTAQEAYDLCLKLEDEDDADGYISDPNEQYTIVKINK